MYAYLHARVCRGASDQRTSARESQARRDLCASGSALRSFIQDESHVPEAPNPTTTPLLYPLRFTFRISATDRVLAFPFFCLVSRSSSRFYLLRISSYLFLRYAIIAISMKSLFFQSENRRTNVKIYARHFDESKPG